MADYTTAELLNEVSKVFRASLSPGKAGGSLNTATEYQQLLEMASITFLFNPDAVFYVARLAANKLNVILLQEVAVLEDMLVALDDLGQIGSPVRDTTTLSNARTAVLSLDAAGSVTNRPETQRFLRQMDTFATQLRKNLVSSERNGSFVRPREEARDIVQENLLRLSKLHSRMLVSLDSLRNTLDDFLSLDLPSRVSTTALSSINQRLQSMIEDVDSSSNTDNIAASRQMFLATLANKISVKILTSFTDPTEFKFRGPTRPIPATMKHLGRVVGEGTPASVLTSAGPWSLPVSAPLVLSVSGSAPISVDLDTIKGAVLNARHQGDYEITAERKNLHVCVDPTVYQGVVVGTDTDAVELSGNVPLGFKHLGAPVTFLDADTGADPDDIHTRFIAELRPLQWAQPSDVSFSNPVLTLAATMAVEEGAVGLLPAHVGAYIMDSNYHRFEILQVLSSTQCVIDTRGLTPDFGFAAIIVGGYSTTAGTTKFIYAPSLTTSPLNGDRVTIGPTVKTAQLTLGTRTAAQVVADIQSEAGVFEPTNIGAALNWHMSPELVSGDSSRVCLRIRSKANPFIQISGRFLHPKDPAGLATIESASAHPVLGYYEGEQDTTNSLTPSELVAILQGLPGLTAEAVVTEVSSGTLSTVALTNQVSVASTVGVQPGDQVEISEGVATGTYQVSSVGSGILFLSGASFTAKAPSPYRVFREQVRISVTDAGPDTSLTVVSGPSELGLTSGTTYSAIPRFEAVDKLGKKLTFTGVVPGDLLRVVGQDEVAISEVVDGTTLVLATGLPSTTSKMGFEIRSAAARAYKTFNASLNTFAESRNLLKKNNFDQGVQAIDNACTTALLPGQNFLSARNQAKRMVADLLSLLTSSLLREDEYTTSVTPNSHNLSDVLASYEAAPVAALDSFLEALIDRKYDRAAALLRAGRFTDFYNTTNETASYSGAVMSASRRVVRDLPRVSRTRYDFLRQRDVARSTLTLTDAESDFSDVANEPEDYDL